jgi:hypothetical protein
VVRKGARKAQIPLTAATVAVLDAYLADRAHSAGVPGLAAADGVPAGHRRWAAPPESLVGAGALPGPHRRDRRVGAALAALPAPLGDHLRHGRRGLPARRPGLCQPQRPPHHPSV